MSMGPGMTEAGGIYEAYAQRQAGLGTAKLQEMNAEIAGQQRQSELNAGTMNADRERMQTAALIGKQKAQIGANNVQLSGTPMQLLEKTASIGELDAQTISLNAQRKAWGFAVQQQGDLYRAELAKSQAFSQPFGTLLTSTAKAYQQQDMIDNPS